MFDPLLCRGTWNSNETYIDLAIVTVLQLGRLKTGLKKLNVSQMFGQQSEAAKCDKERIFSLEDRMCVYSIG